MRSGAEGLGGVDDDVEQAGARRRPRRAHEQVADPHRLVEGLPALVPVVGHLARGDLDQRPAGGRAQVGQVGQLAGRAVDGVLDDVAVLALLHPARRQLEQLGEHELGLLALHPQGEADQHGFGIRLAPERRFRPVTVNRAGA